MIHETAAPLAEIVAHLCADHPDYQRELAAITE
jgi:hypothetical protein